MQYWRSSSKTTERGRSVSCCNRLAMRLTKVQLNLVVQGSPTTAGTNCTTSSMKTSNQPNPKSSPAAPLPAYPHLHAILPLCQQNKCRAKWWLNQGSHQKSLNLAGLNHGARRCYRRVGRRGQEHLKLGLLPNALHSQTTALDSLLSTAVSYLTLTMLIWATVVLKHNAVWSEKNTGNCSPAVG